MGRRLLDHEMACLKRAFDAACDEATLTGCSGRDVIRRIVLERYTTESSEDEFKSLVRKIIAQRRGLRPLDRANEN